MATMGAAPVPRGVGVPIMSGEPPMNTHYLALVFPALLVASLVIERFVG